MLRGASHVLVACSGGPDSQALLHVLHALRPTLGIDLSAAGVDHQLRPEAAQELALAGALAERLGIPFATLRVQVPAGASRQAQAREVRYRALHGEARARGADRIAVGHTLDDQAETVLAKLLRGSGIEGLGGAAPARADGVVRPLIDAPRALVHRYVQAAGLACAHDPSNLDPRFLRVRVRTGLLPALCAENPRLVQQLGELADDAREVGGLLAERTERALARSAAPVAALGEEPPLVRRFALKRLIERETGVPLRRAHLNAVERMLFGAEGTRGQVRVPGNVVVSLGPDGALAFARVTKRGRGGSRPSDRAGTR